MEWSLTFGSPRRRSHHHSRRQLETNRSNSFPRGGLVVTELQQIDVGSWFRTEVLRRNVCQRSNSCFELYGSTNSLLYLEMKPDPGERERLAQACVEKVNTSSLKERIIVECFDLSALSTRQISRSFYSNCRLVRTRIQTSCSLPQVNGL
jgi:hypothetical protein